MLEHTKITAIVVEDTKAGLYTVFSEGIGGPVVSDPDYETACKKFEKALRLSCAIQNLITFTAAVESIESATDENSSMQATEPNVEYVRKQPAA